MSINKRSCWVSVCLAVSMNVTQTLQHFTQRIEQPLHRPDTRWQADLPVIYTVCNIFYLMSYVALYLVQSC